MTFLGIFCLVSCSQWLIALELFKTPHVWLLFLWVSTMGMTTYFYLTTLYDNLLWLFHADRSGDPTRMNLFDCMNNSFSWIVLIEVDHLTTIFSILFIVTPSIAVPLFGIVTFKYGTYASVFLAYVPNYMTHLCIYY
jgi:hypothetical protein